MRVIEILSRGRCALALALLAWTLQSEAKAQEAAPAPSAPEQEVAPAATAPAQEAAPAPAPPTPATPRASRGAPIDLAAFPPRAASQPDARDPGVEVHGYVAAWVTPATGNAPSPATDAFRLRFAILRVDARATRNVTAMVRLGLTAPSSPLLDATVTYAPHAAFGVTAGQFRLPIGAAATTLAPQLVMLDRPSYVIAMTKATFRDVGVMFHSGPRGIANGLLHYRAVVASGGGRAGVGTSRAPGNPADALYAVRVIFEPSRLLFASPTSRLALGASYAHSHDPAIATGTAATDRNLATNILGRTLAPFDLERVTQLGGGDLTFEHRGVHAQAEVLYMHSRSVDKTTTREALGTSLELAYTIPRRLRNTVDFQLAARGERFDPRLGNAHDQQHLLQVGLNAIAGPVRGSVFGTMTFFDDPTSGVRRNAAELTFRAAAAF